MRKLLVIFLTIVFIGSSALDPTFATTLDQGQIKVSRLSVVNVTTTAGNAPVLPSTVTATMSDGTTKTVNVNWGTISQRSSIGNYIIIGTIAESSTINVIATVRVVDEKSVDIPTIQQVQQDIIGTWKTSDEKYILEFRDNGTLKETVFSTGYTAIYEGSYSLKDPNWIKITNFGKTECDKFVLNGDRLKIYNLGISRIIGNSNNFRNTVNFVHPCFAQSSNSLDYEFTRVD